MELLLTAHSLQHSLQPYLLFSTPTSNSLFVQAFQIPLYGLLFIPACFLILGGYIAASGDMQNRTRASLLRGVSIALPYTLLLLFIALLTNGPIPIEGNYGAYYNNTYTLRIDITSLFVFGLLWGALFGLIGASLKLARGHWRAMFYGAIQHSHYRRRLSIVSDAGAAFLLGLLLSLFCVVTALMLPSILTPLLTHTSCPVLTQSSWQILCWSLIQGPQYAAYLFMASLGAPITVTNTLGGGNSLPLQCLSPMQTPSMSMNLLGSLGQIQHIWLILLVALPAISLFIGGRLSVALDRTQTRNSSLLQGAFISIPFALLVALLAQINTSSWTNFSAGNGTMDTSTYYSEAGHSYAKPGTYTVTLIVVDQLNQSSQPFTTTITINASSSSS